MTRPASRSVATAIGATLAAWAIGANALAQNQVQDLQGETKKPAAPINTIKEVFAALEACWVPPGLDQARAGMQITVMVSFKRSGELLGKPRITYETPDASEDERLSYRVAMAEALRRCTPLPFTEALGNALAGRPMTLRFIDNRKLKQATLEQAGTAHD
jgi:hypothetical protein